MTWLDHLDKVYHPARSTTSTARTSQNSQCSCYSALPSRYRLRRTAFRKRPLHRFSKPSYGRLLQHDSSLVTTAKQHLGHHQVPSRWQRLQFRLLRSMLHHITASSCLTIATSYTRDDGAKTVLPPDVACVSGVHEQVACTLPAALSVVGDGP